MSYIFSQLFLFLMPSECFYVFLSGTFSAASATVMNFYLLHELLLKPTIPARVSEALDTVGIMRAHRFWGRKLGKKTINMLLEIKSPRRCNNTKLRITVGQSQNSSQIINNNTTEWHNNSATHCRTAGLSLIGGNDHIRQHKERSITLWKHEIIRWQRKSRC